MTEENKAKIRVRNRIVPVERNYGSEQIAASAPFSAGGSHGNPVVLQMMKKESSNRTMKFTRQMSQKTVTLDAEPIPVSLRKGIAAYKETNSGQVWKYESLNFDMMQAKVYKERRRDKCGVCMEWFAYAFIGVCVGLITAIMSRTEAFIIHEKRLITDHIIGGASSDLLRGWLFYSGISVFVVMIASYLTAFKAPGAAGSGNAELIAYLNGVNYPGLIGFGTLAVKIIGVTLAVIGGLCVGKEGPLAHIGANIGAAVAYFPFPRFEYLRNDKNKRELVAAGCSAGVSAAFGAPIGGALFAYELSKPNDFWKFSVLWKSFFACSTAVFSVAIFAHSLHGKPTMNVEPAELKFGGAPVESPGIDSLPAALITGVICGLLGAFFVAVNTRMFHLRKKHIKTNC